MKALFALLLTAAVPAAHADAQAPCEPRSTFSIAVGFGVAEELRADYGASSRAAFVPELLALGYIALPTRDWFLRPGVRVGYDGLGQPEMPRDVRVVERGLHELLELGLLFDWVVVPAVSVGAGLQQRFVTLETAGAVKPSPALDHSESMAVVYAALGLGVPIARGLVVIEPFLRLQHAFGDDRSLLRFGLDASLRL